VDRGVPFALLPSGLSGSLTVDRRGLLKLPNPWLASGKGSDPSAPSPGLPVDRRWALKLSPQLLLLAYQLTADGH